MTSQRKNWTSFDHISVKNKYYFFKIVIIHHGFLSLLTLLINYVFNNLKIPLKTPTFLKQLSI